MPLAGVPGSHLGLNPAPKPLRPKQVRIGKCEAVSQIIPDDSLAIPHVSKGCLGSYLKPHKKLAGLAGYADLAESFRFPAAFLRQPPRPAPPGEFQHHGS